LEPSGTEEARRGRADRRGSWSSCGSGIPAVGGPGNGPDLFVYLSTAAADARRDTFDDDFLSLGRLKANRGSQNYSIAAGASPDRYRSAVI
jgi:hypothetical protein